ncbi:CPBP family intramembrane metalloprotease [Staphylococcus aureus]|nr:CPBP family intramembrane metalloprotease [Staphylococcus aureus]MBH4540501.1 CPBP family intramembrane metalloprotease [Staphylococcus aureus]MBH4544903.1 CPBP family intramembrane metalloprotease [Staphylococcus aureus]MBH4551936.1 CPBP family intramembrane metalloprotease [Staphylococcus aureus]MBH4554481.1 CPBP family intramembrane metalloprotease [Staphylococcus aureus]
MDYLKNIFHDDLSVNNQNYFKAILKSLLLIVLFFIAFFSSDYVTKGWQYGFISLSLLCLCLFFSKLLKFNFFNLKLINYKEILIIFMSLVLIKVLDYILSFWQSAVSPNDESIIQHFSGTPFLLLAISIAIVPAIVEELIFRGFLLRVFFRKHLFIGTLVSSFLFAILHDGSTVMDYIPYFYFGVILSISYLITKRIEVPILIHFLNNFFALFYVFS